LPRKHFGTTDQDHSWLKHFTSPTSPGWLAKASACFTLGDGLLIGVDVATMQYDGAYTTKPDGSLEGVVQYVLPAGASLITGAPAGVAPTRIATNLSFPADFADGRVIRSKRRLDR
jgi:hypothetical protein